jgi:hypothetical protein
MKKQEVQIQCSTNEEILTPSQAGKLFSVSGWAMYKRAKKGTAPAHKIGNRIYFLKSELIAYIINS